VKDEVISRGLTVGDWILAGGVFVGGLAYALSVLDVRLGPLLGAVGIGGVAVALAGQSLLADLFSSVVLQVRRPFRRGDEIATNDCEGRVEKVNFRTVIVRTWDGERAFVPSSKVLNAPIINYSSLGRRRTTLTIGVAYASPLETVQRVLLEAVDAVDGVLESPAAGITIPFPHRVVRLHQPEQDRDERHHVAPRPSGGPE